MKGIRMHNDHSLVCTYPLRLCFLYFIISLSLSNKTDFDQETCFFLSFFSLFPL